MKYRPTVLNISAGIFLTGILVYSILTYKTGDFLGRDLTIVLVALGLTGCLTDFFCQFLFKNTKMPNVLGTIGIVFILGIIILYNLPFQWTRHSDIKFGNKLIEKIEMYRAKEGKLPENDDWEIFRDLGFKMEEWGTKPTYTKIDSANYELVYLEGFDGPYLLWNTKTKKWKMDFATIPNREKE